MPETVITSAFLNNIKHSAALNAHQTVIKNAIIKNGINKVAYNNDAANALQHTFSHEVKSGSITNQQRSGRCWIFAGLNTLRKSVADQLNLDDFELSQTYGMFWDKLEKANYFYENILDTLQEPEDGRLVMWLLSDPLQDGGQWDMFADIVAKYGVVPKYVMPDTFHSANSAKMNELLTRKLRKGAAVIRKMYQDGADADALGKEKESRISEFYRILVYFLGEPPETFDFEYKDKDESYHHEAGFTPLSFMQKYVDADLDDYVSIINAPTSSKPFYTRFTIDYLGSVKGGRIVNYLNLPVEEMKALALAQLKDNEPVWFGCDVAKMLERDQGILDESMYLYEQALDTSFDFEKGERLDYGDSAMSHAMVFTGVNLDRQGNPGRWKVENSWGDKVGKNGYYIMSDAWFDAHNYQVVINKKHLTDDMLRVLEQDPVHLPPWDPMGSLARMK